ncbi:type II secretion system protein [Trabulsiella odontotermitis]|uniref:type II secretion system protein n=1 Tax=Trabulsiella odontotermitis TaxID=379893 RepID=UPI00092F7ADB|nr:shufflon system plasmid conjugative transfer pilus tip adhesin PilV [Trabulsiella odontotermitis]
MLLNDSVCIVRNIKQKGFTLIELILTLTVIAIISFVTFQSLNKDFENKQAAVLGEQISNVGTGVNNYIVNHYDVLSKLTDSAGNGLDPGPRTCDATKQICEISTQTLSNEGLLPPASINRNVFGSGYKIIISRKGTAPYWSISALITTDKPLLLGSSVRYDLLGKAMQAAGADSGMTRDSATKVDGYKGTWSTTQADYSNVNNQGLLVYIAGYGSNSYSAFLRRDGTLPMTGDLNMGTKNIYGATNITASGTASAATLKSTGDAGVGGDLAVVGISTLAGAVNANNTLTVAGTSSLKGATAVGSTLSVAGISTLTGAVNANSTLTVAGASSLKGATAVSSTLSVAGISTLTGAVNASSTLTVAGASTLKGAVTVNNAITASGNITSSGQVKGATVASTGRMTTGEFLQINGTATAGAACSPNGLIGKNSQGQLLSCAVGVWKSTSGGGSGFFTVKGIAISDAVANINGRKYSAINTSWIRQCVAANNKTGSCSCPNSTDTMYVTGFTKDGADDPYYVSVACSPN